MWNCKPNKPFFLKLLGRGADHSNISLVKTHGKCFTHSAISLPNQYSLRELFWLVITSVGPCLLRRNHGYFTCFTMEFFSILNTLFIISSQMFVVLLGMSDVLFLDDMMDGKAIG